MKKFLLILLILVSVGLLTAWWTTRPAASAQEVLVAAGELAVGHVITSEDLSTASYLPGALPNGALQNETELVGKQLQVARAAGDAASRPWAALRLRLGLTALTALSLFLLLVGCGRLLIPAPGGSGWTTALCIVGGLALVPFWWRGAFHVEHLEPLPGAEAIEEAESPALRG